MVETDILKEYFELASKTLAKELYTKLDQLQSLIINGSCSDINLFVCDLPKTFICGFGCQMHHFVRCLILAFYYKLPMKLEFDWPMMPEWTVGFFKNKFKCGEYDAKRALWSSNLNDILFKQFIPEYYLKRLKTFHSEPLAWWSGHFASYIMDLSDEFIEHLKLKDFSFDLPKPCVG